MLILRCVFWLSVVYAAILSHGTFRWDDARADAVGIARSGASSVIGTASAGAATYCARHADACLSDAARLSALFAAAEPQALETFAGDDAPKPVAEPRHHRRDAKLTRTP